MKKTKKLTLCAVFSALITVLMLTAYFPYLTYAIPAFSGALTIIPLVEFGKKYGFATFLASVLPVLLFCEIEAKLMYLCLFGWYPVLKAVFENLKSRVLEYLLKFLTFNASLLLVYGGLSKLFGLNLLQGEEGIYILVFALAVGNIAFLLYDICLSRLAVFYLYRLRKLFAKFFN